MRKLICLFILLVGGAQPAVAPEDLPRTPPVEPAEALKTFAVREGFHLELAAAEPLVVDPVAMAFDEDGRLFVVEMRDYSERRDEQLGRIRLLIDEDGDGRFDKATVYAENLPWPTALICYGGGIFVGATPDIIFFKDTNGDGVADEQKVVFTGFGGINARLNVQQLLNSFNWGLDNRIHSANGGSTAAVTSPEHPERKSVDIRGRDFSFDPRTLDFRAENGGAQHGLSFDATGHKFVCSNSHHIQALMHELRYSTRNPHYAMPPALVDIAADGPAAEVYRTSPEEPWRVMRTKWRVSGLVPGPIEGGGRSAGYFTGATGVTIYRGDAWGPEFLGDAFIGDAGGNLIHRKKVLRDGVGFIAQRPADEQKREFITSRDNWFRPVQFANGPDGNLYIADMYREVIEHPWSLPESIKKHLDLNSGNDRGRIYRIVKDGFKRPALPRLGALSTADLVPLLEHANGWHRQTASRLIFARQDKSAIEPLTKLVKNSASAIGRVHALYVLDALAALNTDLLLIALDDRDHLVRQHALRLAEKFPSDALWPKVAKLADDSDIRVRYQAAFSIGEFRDFDRGKALSAIAQRDAANPRVSAAIFSSASNREAEMFAILFADKKFAADPSRRQFLHNLVTLIAARDEPSQIARVRDSLSKTDNNAIVFSLAHGLGEGLRRAEKSLANFPEMMAVFQDAAKVALDPRSDESLRLSAIQLLGLWTPASAQPRLLSLLGQRQPLAVQSAVVAALDRLNSPDLPAQLLEKWPVLTPRLRSDVLGILLKRPQRATALLRAVSSGTIRAAELSSTQLGFLRNHNDGPLREFAAKVLGTPPRRARQAIINALLPALDRRGDASRGKVIFQERCASCHRMGADGFALGPDLVTVKDTGREKLLVNIIDPNREVASQFSAYQVDTAEGETLLGIIASETATTITLRQAYGLDTVIFRSNIKRLKNQGESIMPEGLEEGLKPQAVADLLEYVTR